MSGCTSSVATNGNARLTPAMMALRMRASTSSACAASVAKSSSAGHQGLEERVEERV